MASCEPGGESSELGKLEVSSAIWPPVGVWGSLLWEDSEVESISESPSGSKIIC